MATSQHLAQNQREECDDEMEGGQPTNSAPGFGGVKTLTIQTSNRRGRHAAPSLREIKSKRKKDALALAHLLYDMYRQDQNDGKIENGQNNANQPKKN